MPVLKILNAGPVQDVPVDAVKMHPDNPHVGDVEEIKALILANGFYGALLVQVSTMWIIAGNHRYLALKALGAVTVPVQFVDVDEPTASAILAADNRSAKNGHEKEDVLVKLLASVQDARGSLQGTGYSDGEMNALLHRLRSPPPLPGAPPPSAGSVLAQLQEDAAQQREGTPPSPRVGQGLGTPVVAYNIIFDNAEQQERWYLLIRHLRTSMPQVPTIGGRLDIFVHESLKVLGVLPASTTPAATTPVAPPVPPLGG